MRHQSRIASFAFLACLWASPALADPVHNLFQATTDGSAQQSPILDNFSLAMHFETTNGAIIVTGVGFYDEREDTGPGLLNEHAVSVIRLDGTVMATAIIPAGNPPAGATYSDGFWYVPVDPVFLPSGGDYFVVAGMPDGNQDPNANTHGWQGPPDPLPPFAADLPVDFNGQGYLTQVLLPTWNGDSTAQTIPATPDAGGPLNRYHAGSIQYMLPEPTSLALLGAGAALVALRRRRRKGA